LRHWSKRLFLLLVVVAGAALLAVAWRDAGIGASSVNARTPVVFESNENQLTLEWFRDYTGLSRGIASNIFELRAKLLRFGQVKFADIARTPDGTGIIVKVVERTPILRLDAVLPDGTRVNRVVALDGVVYSGTNYGRAVFYNLPLLMDARPEKSAAGDYDIVPGMETVGRLLHLARHGAPELYSEWAGVSVREFADGQVGTGETSIRNIRVLLHEPLRPSPYPRIREIIFSAKDFENEFVSYYAHSEVRAAIEARLRQRNKAGTPFFDWDLTAVNRTDRRHPVKEPRLSPSKPSELTPPRTLP
jgi:hypothetical protein